MTQMLRSPKFGDVSRNCELPFRCKSCLNSGITYIRSLVDRGNNIKMSTCRDATYAALASRVDTTSALELASCFFNVSELTTTPGRDIPSFIQCRLFFFLSSLMSAAQSFR